MNGFHTDPMFPLLYSVRRVRENDDTFTLELEPSGRQLLPVFGGRGQYAVRVRRWAKSHLGERRPSKPYRLVTCTGRWARSPLHGRSARERPVGRARALRPHWPMESRQRPSAGHRRRRRAGRCARQSITSWRPPRFGGWFPLYGAPDDILFPRELAAWRQDRDVTVEVTVDHATNAWRGNVGTVTTLISRTAFDPADAIAMVCGPEIMMRFAGAALTQAGLPSDAIYLSMERNMKCAVGFCGHCQFGPFFICRDGPVMRFDQIQDFFGKWEV